MIACDVEFRNVPEKLSEADVHRYFPRPECEVSLESIPSVLTTHDFTIRQLRIKFINHATAVTKLRLRLAEFSRLCQSLQYSERDTSMKKGCTCDINIGHEVFGSLEINSSQLSSNLAPQDLGVVLPAINSVVKSYPTSPKSLITAERPAGLPQSPVMDMQCTPVVTTFPDSSGVKAAQLSPIMAADLRTSLTKPVADYGSTSFTATLSEVNLDSHVYDDTNGFVQSRAGIHRRNLNEYISLKSVVDLILN